MKHCTLILVFLFSFFFHSNAQNQSKTQFAQTIRIGKLEIMSEDVGVMSWASAKELAEKKLGAEWRLPTIEELKLMYKRRDKLGTFIKDSYYVNYLSSSVVTINSEGEDKFLVLNFKTGQVEKGALNLEMYNVRFVKNR